MTTALTRELQYSKMNTILTRLLQNSPDDLIYSTHQITTVLTRQPNYGTHEMTTVFTDGYSIYQIITGSPDDPICGIHEITTIMTADYSTHQIITALTR